MKNLFFLLLILSNSILFAQSKAETAVANAVLEWRKAMIDGDKVALEKTLAPQLSYGHSSGKIETKTDLLESIGSGKSDFISMELTEQTIQITGKLAIVRHKLMGETNDNGKTGTIKLFVLHIWQKQGGKWLLLARQAAKQP
jgi:ketosteroid isomerase-like protein